MSTLWWVRHGPTHAKGMVGWSDIPADLSDTGALQRLSDFLPKTRRSFRRICSAPATADAIAGTRTRLPDIADLREIHFGEWELRSFDEIEAEDPIASTPIGTSPATCAHPAAKAGTRLPRAWTARRMHLPRNMRRRSDRRRPFRRDRDPDSARAENRRLRGLQPPDRQPFGHRLHVRRGLAGRRDQSHPVIIGSEYSISVSRRRRYLRPMTYELFIGDRTYSSWSLRGWLMFENFGIPVRTRMVGLY